MTLNDDLVVWLGNFGLVITGLCGRLACGFASRGGRGAGMHVVYERIAEAKAAHWLGEAEGLKVSLAGARHKLAQMDEITAHRHGGTQLGMPDVAGRAVTTPATHPARQETR